MASEQIGSRGENKPCTIVSHHRSFGRGADSEGPGSRGKRSHCDHFSSKFSVIPVQVKYGEMRVHTACLMFIVCGWVDWSRD